MQAIYCKNQSNQHRSALGYRKESRNDGTNGVYVHLWALLTHQIFWVHIRFKISLNTKRLHNLPHSVRAIVEEHQCIIVCKITWQIHALKRGCMQKSMYVIVWTGTLLLRYSLLNWGTRVVATRAERRSFALWKLRCYDKFSRLLELHENHGNNHINRENVEDCSQNIVSSGCRSNQSPRPWEM